MSGMAALTGVPVPGPDDEVFLAGVTTAMNNGVTHEPFGNPAGPGLWHHKGTQLPAYIQQVAHGLVKSGMTESRAIATAVSRCKVWCAGGDSVKADTRAKACAAVAEWEALKVKAHGDDHKAAAPFDPSKHPRQPAGPGGGEFAPGAGGKAPTNAKPVAQGQSGKQVSDLQKRLAALGFGVKVDGKFGSATSAAVRKYQAAHGLKVDGLVGPKTTAALRGKHPKTTTTRKRKPKRAVKTSGAAPAGIPELVTMPGVDLLAAGSWELSSGRNTFTRDDIKNAIEAAACPAVGPPVIKLGHVDPRFDGQPSIGRVMNMRADEGGSKLVGDLVDMPGWLAGVARAAFPRRSVEGSYGFRCQIGHTHPFVLTGLALLGVTAPGVGVLNALPDIASLFGIEAASVGRSFRTAPRDMEGAVVAVTEEDVRRAYYAGGGAPATWWITELQMAPTQLVVAGDDGRIYRVPFTIDTDVISFGSAELVDSYAELAASRGTGSVITYASSADSRTMTDYEDDDDDQRDVSAADDAGWVMRDGKWVYDPDGDGDDDSAPGTDTDHSHWDAAGKSLKPVPPNPHKSAAASDPPWMNGDNKTGDKNNASMTTHGAYTGKHSHPHDANDAQGGDATHAHAHTHSGDGTHAHTHAAATTNRKDGSTVDFTDEQQASLRIALGLGEYDELTPGDLVEATAKLRESADAKVSAASRALPPGVVQVSQEVWDGIQRKVDASERFRAKVQRDERDEVVDKAIRDGKFSSASRTQWVRLWDGDPEGTRDTLATLKKNVVPVDDIGVAGGSVDDDAYEAEFASLYPPGTFQKGA